MLVLTREIQSELAWRWYAVLALQTMRSAKSYSIVDHQLLHGGYFSRLSQRALVLYLFLVVVGNRDGRSFYGVEHASSILSLSAGEYLAARSELLNAGLISEHGRYTTVENLGASNR